MIVKIQLPIMCNTVPMALIYSEDHSIDVLRPVEEVRPLFGKSELKIYHHAEIEGTNLMIGDRAPDQEW